MDKEGIIFKIGLPTLGLGIFLVLIFPQYKSEDTIKYSLQPNMPHSKVIGVISVKEAKSMCLQIAPAQGQIALTIGPVSVDKEGTEHNSDPVIVLFRGGTHHTVCGDGDFIYQSNVKNIDADQQVKNLLSDLSAQTRCIPDSECKTVWLIKV
jgi:hypothetical protein